MPLPRTRFPATAGEFGADGCRFRALERGTAPDFGRCALAHDRAAFRSFVAQQRSIDDFFREFSDAWVRMNPNIAVSTRYFWAKNRIASSSSSPRIPKRPAPRGCAPQTRADESSRDSIVRGSPTRSGVRGSAPLPAASWLDSEKYDHYEFPLDQHNGANIGLVTVLSVQHPLRTPRDASNYVARLALVGARMAATVEDAKQRAAKDLIPPRFILDRTIGQMRLFSASRPRRIRSSRHSTNAHHK